MQKEFDAKMADRDRVVAQLQADKEIQQQQQNVLVSQVEALQQLLANLQSPPAPSPSTPTVPLPPDRRTDDLSHKDSTGPALAPPAQSTDDPSQEGSTGPDFDPTTVDADFQDTVNSFEQRLISRLDHEPSEAELEEISIAARNIAAEYYDADKDTLHSSSRESDPIHTPSRKGKGRTDPFASDEDESMTGRSTSPGKRLATTESDEISHSDERFRATQSQTPKKKAYVTGDADPGRHP